jgi:tetratricopeptide (TPR) repeat protein
MRDDRWSVFRSVWGLTAIACFVFAGSATAQAAGAQSAGPPQQPEFVSEGQKLARDGKLDEALALYKKVLQTSPESLAANNGMGVVLDFMGHYKDAQKFLQRAIDVAANPQDKAVAQRTMAMSYAFEGDCKNASAYEQKVFDYWASLGKHFFEQGETANEAGRVCIDAGDLDAAEKWYRKGHDIGLQEPDIKPDRVDLWEFRWEHAQARLAARRGHAGEAQKHVAAAKAVLDKGTNPQQAPFFPYLEGYVAFYSGDYTAALIALQKGNQNDPFIQCLMAQAHEKLGNKEQAAVFYKKAATTAAHNPAGAYARPLATKKIS